MNNIAILVVPNQAIFGVYPKNAEWLVKNEELGGNFFPGVAGFFEEVGGVQ